jgi:FAS-associated factor 2
MNAARSDTRIHETLANGFSSHQTRAPHARLAPAPRIVPPPNSEVTYKPGFPLNLILAPFNLVSFFAIRIFRTLGSFLPFLPLLFSRLQSANRNRASRRSLLPRDTAARFIREFEEEYGENQLPFLEKGYAHSLDEAKRDLKFLLVVLLAPEHDDTPDYVREALLSQDVVSFLRNKDNNTVLWGGSVQDSEAYQISTAFGVTKFPYAALVAHAPARSGSRSGSYATPSGMSIITSLAGPMPASEFLSKIRRAMDSHMPELTRLRAERAERDATRSIREEQDSAYERSLARDRERAKQKREEQERKRREAEEVAQAEQEQQTAAQNLENWKLWRAAHIKPEPPASDKNATRVSLRLPDGQRLIRRFDGTSTVEEIYAFVECWEILKAEAENKEAIKPEKFKHQYGFRLVSPMPRIVYDVKETDSISSVIGRSSNLIVETIDEEE